MKEYKFPPVIELFMYNGDFTDSEGYFYAPNWVEDAINGRWLFWGERGALMHRLVTVDGSTPNEVVPGDYIVKVHDVYLHYPKYALGLIAGIYENLGHN